MNAPNAHFAPRPMPAFATGLRIERAEFVLPGHPDRLCDAVADTLVAHMTAGDARAQCGIEVACVFDRVFVTGRIAGAPEPLATLDVPALVARAYREAGYGVDAAGRAWGPLPEALRVDTALCRGEFEPGERELRHCADDQALCIGFATPDPATDHLPPAHWLARRIGRELARLRGERGAGEVGPDGKVLAQVAVGRDGWRPSHVSISLNHHEGSDWLLLRRLAQEAVETACAGRALPELVLNGAGMFVAGGPNGDNGTTGKKLVVDAYGPTVPIGGGAWSGKDFNKVDRLGAMLARRLAKARARATGEATRVEIAYVPGSIRPQSISLASAAGQADVDPEAPVEGWSTANAEVTGRCLAAPALDPPTLARWGHFGHGTGPWEQVA